MNVLNRRLFRKSHFITVSGVDGVGKSTVVNEISSILQRRGINSHTFHYRAINKHPKKKGDSHLSYMNKLRGNQRPSFPIGFLRRFMPGQLKLLVRSSWNKITTMLHYIRGKCLKGLRNAIKEYGYLSAINKELHSADQNDAIAIVDRYWYDRIAQIDMMLPEFVGQSLFVAHMMCFMAKKPSVAILLRDDPKQIYYRKNEIPLNKIPIFQNKLESIIRKYANNFFVVQIAGRDARAIALEVLRITELEIRCEFNDIVDEL